MHLTTETIYRSDAILFSYSCSLGVDAERSVETATVTVEVDEREVKTIEIITKVVESREVVANRKKSMKNK